MGLAWGVRFTEVFQRTNSDPVQHWDPQSCRPNPLNTSGSTNTEHRVREGDRLSVQAFTIRTFFLHKLLLSLFSDSQKAAFITLWNISFNWRSICSLALLPAGCTCQRGSSVPGDVTRQSYHNTRTLEMLLFRVYSSARTAVPLAATSTLVKLSQPIHKQDNHICWLFKTSLTNIKIKHLLLQKIRQAWEDYHYYFSSRTPYAFKSHTHDSSSHISTLLHTSLGPLCSKRDLYSLILSECQGVIQQSFLDRFLHTLQFAL